MNIKTISLVVVLSLIIFLLSAAAAHLFTTNVMSPQADPAPKEYSGPLTAIGDPVTLESLQQSAVGNLIYLVRISTPRELKVYYNSVVRYKSFYLSHSPMYYVCQDTSRCGVAILTSRQGKDVELNLSYYLHGLPS